MPNKNYESGRRYEYKIVHSLKKAGFDIVFRSAGSHGPIDVVAIDTSNRTMLFVQAKHLKRKLSYDKKLELKHKWIKLNDKYLCKFEVI